MDVKLMMMMMMMMMTLSHFHTLQNVIQAQNFEPCQLNKLSAHPFMQGAFHLTQPHPHVGKPKHDCPESTNMVANMVAFNHNALDNSGFV